MGFMDKLGSAANAAKWKADQQMRVMRVQNSIHDLEKQVNTHKAALADTALELYTQDALTEERLGTICAAIRQLETQLGGLNDTLHQIQSEQPPSEGQAAPAPAVAPAPIAAVPAPVVFVPTPVAASPLSPVAAPAPLPDPQPAVLVCPECGQVLKGKFCPEHGVAGVPQ
jgi:hypothetical protein